MLSSILGLKPTFLRVLWSLFNFLDWFHSLVTACCFEVFGSCNLIQQQIKPAELAFGCTVTYPHLLYLLMCECAAVYRYIKSAGWRGWWWNDVSCCLCLWAAEGENLIYVLHCFHYTTCSSCCVADTTAAKLDSYENDSRVVSVIVHIGFYSVYSSFINLYVA